MYPSPVRAPRTFAFPPAVRVTPALLLVTLLLSSAAVGQIVRPGPINPGGDGVIPGGGGGGGIIPINPILPINPGGGGGINSGPRIVTDIGILAGQSSQASVVVSDQPPTAAASGNTGNTAAAAPTYQWTISGGRITSDPTQETIRFTADAAGTLSLNVVIVAGATSQSSSTQVTVLSPTLAGTITSPATARANAAPLTATVPAAQNGDRTFRWSLAGNGAAITGGQGTNRVTFRPGTAGLLEVMCDVTLQRLATVTVRSFVLVTGDGPPVALTVNGGSGGGTYAAGSRIDIFAHPPPAGAVFDKWIGDTAILGNAPLAASQAHAMITVPTAPVSLTATYRTVPEWSPTVVAGFNPTSPASPAGTALAYHIPAGARGLVFVLHETGGTAASWFASPEKLTLTRDLVAAGYGVAALNSVNRNTATWSTQSTLATNPDMATLAVARDRFVQEERISADTPVFLLGFAAGADAATRFAQQLVNATPARTIKGTILYCATGSTMTAATSRVPQLFALAAHDEALGTAGNSTARDHSQLLAGRGIPTEVVSKSASPLPAGRLRALGLSTANFSAADAEAIWTALKSAGLIDANNFPRSTPNADTVRAALPAELKSHAPDVVAQLAIAYGAQEFFSDANPQVIAFLNDRVASKPAPEPGRVVNLSTRTNIAYLGDTLSLGFTLTGTQPASLLIRGVGPSLSRFGVTDALPAPVLDVSRGRTLIASSESWDTSPGAAEIITATAAVGAFPLARGSRDTAVLVRLEPGAYTATISSVNGAVGGVLAEIYDVSKNTTRLTNLSTLAKIGTDGVPLIPAIVVAGNTPRTLVVRAVGAGLTELGFAAHTLLDNPRLSVLNGGGQMIATNNNWTQTGTTTDPTMLNTVFAAAGAFPLQPANADAALVTALAPGSYTLQITAGPGVALPFFTPAGASLTGAVLVEVYEVQ